MYTKRLTPRRLLLTLLLTLILVGGSVVAGKAATSVLAARGAATVTTSALATAPGTATPTSTAATLPDIAGAAAKVRPATVLVLNLVQGRPRNGGLANPTPTGSGTPQGAGTGFIIDPSGVIVTNNHVVEGAQALRVVLPPPDNRSFDAQLVGRDPQTDLAVIKIAASNLPTVPLGNSGALRPGDWVVAIGNALDLPGGPTVTQGVVSAIGRDEQEPPSQSAPSSPGPTLYDLIQTDAAINPGNSGGPLCNLRGEIIGINTAIESDGGGSIGIGFAIPINAVRFVVDQLLAKGKVSYGYLGVQPTSITPRHASTLKVERGALIELEPDPGSPASAAGMKAGDVVIAINGKPVYTELDLRTIVGQTAPNTTVEMTVIREGKETKLKATLEEARDLTPEAEPKERQAKLGIEVEPLTKDLARKIGVAATSPGVVVKSIEDTAAANEVEELVEGAIILKVNDTETNSVKAFQEATANLKAGDKVRVYFQVGRVRKFAVIEVD